ncbi:hypothetical protein QQF64_008210 [Cirrhinus molitorella]|uniref:Uncharacterized protein n=1 Tax=Cirrhinus molitorella TaxID=172907 RepID=A0ABR3M5I4_9TELE
MSLWPVAMETEHERRPWGLVNTHTHTHTHTYLVGEMDGVSPSAGVRGCRFRVVALATVAGLIGGGGAVRLGCLMQTEDTEEQEDDVLNVVRIACMSDGGVLRGSRKTPGAMGRSKMSDSRRERPPRGADPHPGRSHGHRFRAVTM